MQLLESMQLDELTSSPNCIRESSRFHFKPVVVTCSQTKPPRGISPHVLPSPLRYSLQRSIQVDPGGNRRKVLFEPTRTKSLKNRFASIKELMIPTQQRLLVNMKQALVQIGIVLIGVPHDVGAVGFVIGDDVVLNGVKVTLRVRSTIEQKP